MRLTAAVELREMLRQLQTSQGRDIFRSDGIQRDDVRIGQWSIEHALVLAGLCQ